MTLSETVELMNSEDYHDRLIAEYVQIRIRYDKLRNVIGNRDIRTQSMRQIDLLITQANIMEAYMSVLSIRLKSSGLYLKACEYLEGTYEKE